jgi:hypothetical protein
MRTQDRLLTRTLRVTLPLVIWGVHFFFCYAYAAVACQRGGPPGTVLAVLGAISLLAVAAAALLFGQASRVVCRQGAAAPGFYEWVTFTVAALSLVAIVWTCVPMLMVEVCSGPSAAV